MSTPDPVEALLSQLTRREQVGQLNQRLYGWDAVRRVGDRYELTDAFHTEVERWGGLGALYGVFRADAWSGRHWDNGVPPQHRAQVAALVQDAVRAGSRHGIGALVVEEAPHGHQALGGALFPVNLNVGASWDPDLYQECSRVLARTLRADGVHLALVSALDLLRDPRWGRAEECYGESAFLSARLCAALVHGMQGTGRRALADGTGVGVVLKHFVAQGEAVGGRNGQSASLGARDLAELHLPAAKAGIDAGAVGVMAAYTDVDGVPCGASKDLLTGVLREQWRFDGVVMADGGALDRLTAMTGSPADSAALAVTAGVDLSLWDHAFTRLEETAGRDPAVAAAVERACRRVLRLKHRFGLLPHPSPADRESVRVGSSRAADVAAAARLSRRLAARSLVLLSNPTDVLPLPTAPPPGRPRRRWLVTGPYADDTTALLGDYVPPLRLEDDRSVRAALAAVAVVTDLPDPLVDAVICVVGGTSHRAYDDAFAGNGALLSGAAATCGEGVDLADLRLPADQLDLLRTLRAATTAPLVAVVVAGRPQVLTEVFDSCDAVLLAGYPGPYGADAIADVLTGAVEPAGRLAATLPTVPGAVPVRHDDRHPASYLDAPDPVLRPFGAGRTYGPQPSRALAAVVGPTGDLTLEVTVTNHGDRPVEDVVQLYGRRLGGAAWPRRRELIGFARVRVEPRAKLDVRLDVPAATAFAAAGRPHVIPRTELSLAVDASPLLVVTADGQVHPCDQPAWDH